MAFKFQVGAARLSGSTTFEEAVAGLGEVKGNTLVSDSTVSGSGALQGASVAVDGTVTGGTLVSNGTISGSATISGGAVTTNGALTGGKLVVGSADMSEADLEQLDGITAGTVAASKAVVVDSNKDISEFRNLQAVQLSASTNIVLGTADLNQTDLEQIDGITAGTAVASKAMVLDSNKDISGARDITVDQDLKAGRNVSGSAQLQGASVAVDGAVAAGSLVVDDGSTIGTDSDADMLTLTNASDITVASDLDFNIDKAGGLQLNGTAVTATATELNLLDTAAAGTVVNSKAVIYSAAGKISASAFVIGSADVSESELEVLDSVTAGTVTASKAVVVDSNKDISAFRNLQAVQLSASSNIVIGSADISESDLEQIDGITAGTAAASKALVLDSSSDISGINNLGASQLSASAKVLAGGAISGSGGLQVGGTIEFYEALTTSNAIVFHTGDGVLTDSANLTFDGSNVLSASGDARFGGTLRVDNGSTLSGAIELQVPEAGVDQAADSIFFRDGDGAVKRDTVVDFVSAIAGAGTQASNGQITVAGTNAYPLSDSNQNLSGGINFFSGAIASARTLTLPSASDDYKGIQFIVKAASNVSNTLTVTITASSDDQVRIDGSTNPVVLESPGAAVTLVGLGATHGWAII